MQRSLKESEEKTANLMKEADEFRKLLDDVSSKLKVAFVSLYYLDTDTGSS